MVEEELLVSVTDNPYFPVFHSEHTRRQASIIKILSRHLATTAAVREKASCTPHTVGRLRQALDDILLMLQPKEREAMTRAGGLFEHITLAMTIAHGLATQLNLNPYTAQVQAGLHDIGRFITHQYLVTDWLSDRIFKLVGISPQITNGIHRLEWFLQSDGESYQGKIEFSQINEYQRVCLIADLLAKRHSTETYRLRKPEEIISEINSAREKYKYQFHTMQDIEYLIDSEHEREIIILCIKWLETMGVSVDDTIIGK